MLVFLLENTIQISSDCPYRAGEKGKVMATKTTAKKMVTKKQPDPVVVEHQLPTMALTKIQRASVDIYIKGLTPLIVNRFANKAALMNQPGVKVKKAPRDPEKSYNDSRYILDEDIQEASGVTDGFPAVAFKAAIVGASRLFGKDVTLVGLRTALYVEGLGKEQLVPIIGVPESREDVVRVGQGVADLRWRATYPEWSATLTVRYIPTQIDFEGIHTLVEAAGMGGVGEWRPASPHSNTGMYGQFTLDPAKYEEQ